MANEFYALMGRMRYITRWGLMRNTFSENIQEHSHQVAVLAHALALIRRDILKLPGPDPDRCAVAALYHDASEILTGDLPTPIKYYNPDIKTAYKQVERIAGQRLLDMLPAALRESYASLVLEEEAEVMPIVKAALLTSYEITTVLSSIDAAASITPFNSNVSPTFVVGSVNITFPFAAYVNTEKHGTAKQTANKNIAIFFIVFIINTSFFTFVFLHPLYLT